ncbi:MAG: adenylosuccinate synthetase, partial [Candidatus Eremiobacteraeota bacterium]|nr:adenylosuccinate synthetase [Candidatus Eremiobacteraeota bacterium]
VVLTKLDVLSGLERVGVVVSYARDGAPISMQSLEDEPLQTEVEWHEGWGELPRDARRLRDLPGNAGRYVEALQRALQVPIQAVSFGAERSEMALS